MAGDFHLEAGCIRRHFDAAADSYDGVDALARAVAQQMDERLEGILHQPDAILDLGCGTGRDLRRLAERYPKALRIGADIAPAMLRKATPPVGRVQRLLGRGSRPQLAAADAAALPFAHGRFDMLWSNLMLNWLDDPAPALKEMARVMKVGGMLMFATLGPDTLRELRDAFADAEGQRVHRFIDMHDIGDALVAAGFSDPVMDMDRLTLTYTDLDSLFADLRQSGSANASAARPRGLSGKSAWQRARARYEARRTDGRLPATFEIVYGHAWKPEPRTTADGHAIVHFQPRRGGPR
ncbi:malonyl-ACP O-methyltransferase BioC [Denitromonas iodatirespirans]|uniref:Malonyl-[acyl-carrier protein] O-methyltransferase n=1 Tax=Denitromonas iodatirespirans TaxID=2795389 RepID=A0A944D8I4_DENI1|nr:malonyl-ACP O-methyltransferase BioC [Denitromonas iodatirespirans]MBT0960552.1 malonyl-ACP O-methyltransferase BioC [Denitromonas iodatirespirans]